MLQTIMGYHSPQNSLWQDKQNSPKNSPTGSDQMHLNSGSPQQLSSSESSPNCEQNNLKRCSTEPLQRIEEHEKKHIRKDGWYFFYVTTFSNINISSKKRICAFSLYIIHVWFNLKLIILMRCKFEAAVQIFQS